MTIATVVQILGVLFLVLALLGAALALWQSRRGPAVNPEGGLDPSAWAKFIDALAKAPLWVSCAVIGIILIFVVAPAV
jgi:hypothetical protein